MKRELRAFMKAVLASISARQRARKSRLARDRLLALPEFAAARSVMLYLPLPEEADASLLAQAAWSAGKTVLAPRVDWDAKTMVAAEIASLTRDMVEGRHHIKSPADGTVWPAERIDLIVAPALAIDRAGNRLGRGGGFYDRFLAQTGPRTAVCAMILHEQLLQELPHFAHDRPVNQVVTDMETLRFAG
jgi:5-formyltetrahydrofolate cyclo-ligase